MSNSELDNEFDILYNNIRNNSAPGLDLYEKSVFLTKAQEQLVFNTFAPEGNKYFEGFENSEKRKRDLENLVRNYKAVKGGNTVTDISTATNSVTGLQLDNFDGYFINIPTDVFFVIQEVVTLETDENYEVLPISHDEVMLQIKNPFRKPLNTKLSKKVWRVNNSNGTNDRIEIIVPNGKLLQNYQMRYVKKPSPIVLTNLNAGEFAGSGLTIDGITAKTECELNPIVHRQIVDRAVLLAIEAYEKSRIQTFPQVSARNE